MLLYVNYLILSSVNEEEIRSDTLKQGGKILAEVFIVGCRFIVLVDYRV